MGMGTQEMYMEFYLMAWLWEEYVNTLIGANAFYHPKIRLEMGLNIFCRKSWYDLSLIS